MSSAERRKQILEKMCLRRFETRKNLAFEFKVSEKTIRRDIQELTLSHPIFMVSGHNGGIYVAEGYYINRIYLSHCQKSLMERLLINLHGEDRQIMIEILKIFSLPEIRR